MLLQKNLQITVTGVASIPGAMPNPLYSAGQSTIYQGTVNGQLGYNVPIALVVTPTEGG